MIYNLLKKKKIYYMIYKRVNYQLTIQLYPKKASQKIKKNLYQKKKKKRDNLL